MYELIKFATQQKIKFPNLAEEIDDLVELCQMEIEEGSSEAHEISLCEDSINQLIKENNK